MGKEIVPNPELRKIALDFYKGPFKFDHMGGYIWAQGDKDTHGNQMFADLDCAKERCARIRGWGALQYLKDVDCEALQDEIGVMFAEAITEYWDRAKNTIVAHITPVGVASPQLMAIIGRLVELDVKHSLTITTGRLDCLQFSEHRRLAIKDWGIDAILREGDIVTLQQDRVFITCKQQN